MMRFVLYVAFLSFCAGALGSILIVGQGIHLQRALFGIFGGAVGAIIVLWLLQRIDNWRLARTVNSLRKP
jgi:hypothetical protein